MIEKDDKDTKPEEESCMNDRERWVRCMHFQSVDYIPDEEIGYDNKRDAPSKFRWENQGFSSNTF